MIRHCSKIVFQDTLQLLLLWILLVLSYAEEEVQPTEWKEWAPNMTQTETVEYLLQNYDKRLPPVSDGPTIVKIGIYVNSFDSISEQSMDYAINIYLRQNWTDPRLKLPEGSPFEEIKLEDGMWNKLWIPDVFFRNEKKASFHDITVANRFMKLDCRGNVWYVTKITAVLSCPMKLHKYPLDTQKCPMMFESFGFTTKTVDFKFLNDEPLQKEKNLTIPQFQLIGWELINCQQNYTTGRYPCLRINFVLKRDLGFYLIQIYVPSILIVILSWVSFWIGGDATVGRVTLGLLTVLSMTTQATSAQADFAKVSYIKALDVWMSTCLLFVFSGFLEFAIVNVLTRTEVKRTTIHQAVQKSLDPNSNHKKYNQIPSKPTSNSINLGLRSRNKAHSQSNDMELSPLASTSSDTMDLDRSSTAQTAIDKFYSAPTSVDTPSAPGDPSQTSPPFPEPDSADTQVRWVTDPFGRQKAKTVDIMSRRLFPVAFALFNFTYWLVFMLVV